MSAASKQPQISPVSWADDTQACPEWVGFPNRDGLPAEIRWSGSKPVPAIGDRVQVHRNGFGFAVVKAYFQGEGFLGVLCEPEVLPEWFTKQNPGVTLVHVFGRELEPFTRKPGPPPAVLAQPEAMPEAGAAQPVRYYSHPERATLLVVRGELADFYCLYDVEAFIGADATAEAQLADPACWQSFGQFQYLEIPPVGQPRIFEVIAGMESNGMDQAVFDQTGQYRGPFRIPGRVPFTATDEPTCYASLAALAAGMQGGRPEYRGKLVQHGAVVRWFVFEEEAGQFSIDPTPWQPVELALGARPLDTYAYHTGERVPSALGMGTVTLWQETAGERRYFVETAPTHQFAPAFPYLEQVSAERMRTWYRFEPAEAAD